MTEELPIEIRDLLANQDRYSRMWNIGDIAWFLCRSKDAARDMLAHPTAPTPVRFANGKRGSDPLWNPEEVREWVLAHKETA